MRRVLIAGLALLASLFLFPFNSKAADYPTRPITLIITSGPGSLSDVLGRLFANELSKQLGQPVIVNNRPGAMTQIATGVLTRAEPDGYTLMLGALELTMMPSLKKNYTVDPTRDMTPVSMVASSWTVLAVNPKVPARTLAELIDYAKANPGKVHFGTNGVGGALHVAVEILKLKTGIDIKHVPYTGGEQATRDAVSGEIEMVSMGLASARAVKDGPLRVLAQTGPVRHPQFADVPTTTEAGLPDVRMDTWFGVVGPPKMPADIVERIDRATAAVAKDRVFLDGLDKLAMVSNYKSNADFVAFMNADLKRWSTLIPALGIPQVE